MSGDGYATRQQRAAAEEEFGRLPSEPGSVAADGVSVVVSVRLRPDELAAVERAAAAARMPLSTFIRQAAVQAAHPLDVRAVSARVRAIEEEAREVVSMLRGGAE